METKRLETPRAMKLAGLLLSLVVVGCVPCYALRLTERGGDSLRVDRGLVTTYGCEAFAGMTWTEDMVPWCIAHNMGDTVTSDVVPGCRPGETPGGCERFWVCE